MEENNKGKNQMSCSSGGTNNFGPVSIISEIKRPRLSEEQSSTRLDFDLGSSEDSTDPAATPVPGNNLTTSGPSDDGEWTTMVSKRKRKRESQDQCSTYPEITFHTKQQAAIRMKDLQNLTLYALIDNIAPSFLAFKNARQVQKVVVLMIPGIELNMFNGSGRFSNMNGNCANSSQKNLNDGQSPNLELNDLQGGSVSLEDRKRADLTAWMTGTPKQTAPVYKAAPTLLETANLPASLEPLKSIFSLAWPVRSPGSGDYRSHRVLSPVETMLVAPIPTPLENKGIKGPRPPAESKSFIPVPTQITAFIHNAEELQEAGYPIHPACFTSPKDAQLEHERRERTNQSTSFGWVNTKVNESTPVLPNQPAPAGDLTCGLTIYALDCEMVITSDDVFSLARISLISYPANTVLIDKYVKPALPVKDYLTQYSGVTPGHLKATTTTLEEIQDELLALLTPSTILLGHSLENDLCALKITHPFIIDTALIYPHKAGLPSRNSLKFLTTKYLSRNIQTSTNGHDSVEDARAPLDLVMMKCEKGLKWGIEEATGESVFKRLARNKRGDKAVIGAMVDYGNAERGYGKDAAFKISCQSDAEVVEGVIRAVHGDRDGKEIKAGGVDFVWGQLRAVEFALGWRKFGDANAPDGDAMNGTDENFDVALKTTVENLTAIHASLPACSLLVVYSGTGDPRPLAALKKRLAQYKAEIKVKKESEMTATWGEAEDQAIKDAVDKARNGVGFVCVK